MINPAFLPRLGEGRWLANVSKLIIKQSSFQNPRLFTLCPQLVPFLKCPSRSWFPMASLCGPLSAAEATFSLICWPGFREEKLQLVWNRKTVNLNFQHDPFASLFSTVMSENRENRMFHKKDNSERIRKMQNTEVCNLFLFLKWSILQNFMIFFFYLCHLWPIRLFSQDILAFILWETSGWVNMEEPRVNKIPADAGAQWEDSSWPHRLRRSPLLPSKAPLKIAAKTPLLGRISQYWWRKSPGIPLLWATRALSFCWYLQN